MEINSEIIEEFSKGTAAIGAELSSAAKEGSKLIVIDSNMIQLWQPLCDNFHLRSLMYPLDCS